MPPGYFSYDRHLQRVRSEVLASPPLGRVYLYGLCCLLYLVGQPRSPDHPLEVALHYVVDAGEVFVQGIGPYSIDFLQVGLPHRVPSQIFLNDTCSGSPLFPRSSRYSRFLDPDLATLLQDLHRGDELLQFAQE